MPADLPVLIVGAGPVGLVASLLLARRGIANLVIDRRPGPHRAPQAHVVNPRTLEILRAAGIDGAALRALATPASDGSSVRWMTTLAGEELGCLPYERQDDAVLDLTPTPLLNLPQHRLEPLLVEALRAYPQASLRYQHEAIELGQDADGVTTHVRDGATGTVSGVRSRWVLAADGAGSRTRRALGIEMVGPERLQSFVMIHFAANLRPLVRERPAILYWTADPSCAGAFVAHDIDRSWVFMHPFDPDVTPAATFTEDVCTAIVQRAIGAGVELAIRDVSPWTMTAQVAASYRAGRVFLVGDSAHRFPPSGGMGMNTGIQDAHNLVWKLAAVEDGSARAALLDTYEAERRPVAERNAEQSLLNAMRLFEFSAQMGLLENTPASQAAFAARVADPVGRAALRDGIEAQQDHFDMLGLHLGIHYASAAIVPDGSTPPVPDNPVRSYLPSTCPGARLPHAWIERAGTRCSTLDLIAEDTFTVLADAPPPPGAPPMRWLVTGRDFIDVDGHWQRASGLPPGVALLVRPDQHIAWRGPPGPDGAALRTAWAHVNSLPPG